VNGQALDAVMSFSVAALLYLVTEELLTEAHEVDETPLLTSMFFVGFVALLTIEMLVSSSDEVMLWHGVEASAAI
jgi:zinc transporter, ZIP family